jgi:hypothetical protein
LGLGGCFAHAGTAVMDGAVRGKHIVEQFGGY